MGTDSGHDDPGEVPDDLDDGLAFADGEDSRGSTSPSVLDRIGEVTGSKPRVLLREESAGDTPTRAASCTAT